MKYNQVNRKDKAVIYIGILIGWVIGVSVSFLIFDLQEKNNYVRSDSKEV